MHMVYARRIEAALTASNFATTPQVISRVFAQ
jgi:hypothetical protein